MRDPAFLSEPFEDWAQEFLASDTALEFRPDVREAGAAPLAAFLAAACRRSGGGLEGVDAGHFVRALRHDLHTLALPAEARPQIPGLVAAFLSFLQETGRLADGAALGRSVLAGASTGEDRAPPLAAGRNDPCPCGSGKKFKKCCGG